VDRPRQPDDRQSGWWNGGSSAILFRVSASRATCVVIDDESLAERLGLPVVTQERAPAGALRLERVDGVLELRRPGVRRGRGVCVDLGVRDLRQGTPGFSKRQPLARAVRVPASVVDATAGLGRDAALLAGLGCDVVAIERNPIVAALLRDGLQRALHSDEPAIVSAAGRIELIEGDAHALLGSLDPPDVVYLDPMYPPRPGASALPRKGAQILRELIGVDQDVERVLERARTAAPRVVLKRPHSERALGGSVSVSFSGKLVRYDVYIRGGSSGLPRGARP